MKHRAKVAVMTDIRTQIIKHLSADENDKFKSAAFITM